VIENRIKHRHLSSFVEVARLKSIGKAAVSLSISQPAVSKTIRELEEILGVELFDRSHRSVVLSYYGEVFLRFASASIAALRQGVESVELALKEGASIVRIGALSSASARVLPEAVARFLAINVGTTPQVITADNVTILNQLRVGELDFALGRMGSPASMVGLTFEHLYTERVAVVARREHPIFTAGAGLSRLSDYVVLVPPPGSIIHDHAVALLIRLAVGPQLRRIDTVSTVFGRAFATSSDAIWIAHYGEVAGDIAAGTLRELPVDTSDTFGPLGLIVRSDVTPSLGAELLMAAIREVSGEVRAGGER
jgi:LysR family pca operon transcriptional activator